MKKIFLNTLITSITIFCISSFCFSGTKNSLPAYLLARSAIYSVDSFIINTPKLHINEVRLNAVRDFIKRFKNIKNSNWYKIPDGFIACFTENEIETKVFYTSNGNWHSTLKTYSENKMPFEIRDLIKSKYYDYTILVMYEIASFDNTAYIIKIEDSKNLKTLRISGDNMEVIETYVRG